ncbi:hypothetical protein V8E54_002194 [Elaphomyces granulatus]
MRSPSQTSPVQPPSPVVALQSHHRRLSRPEIAKSPVSSPNEYRLVTQGDAVSRGRRQDANPIAVGHRDDHLQNTDMSRRLPDNQGSNAQTLAELRRRMEETLVSQQIQQQLKSVTVDRDHPEQGKMNVLPESSPRSPPDAASSFGSIPMASLVDSNSSGNTVRPSPTRKTPDHDVPQTLSYPFPAMSPHTPSDGVPDQDPFNLRFPADKVKWRAFKGSRASETKPSASKIAGRQSIFLPSGVPISMEDYPYPTPNLYDIVLKLNSDPGLDAWWSNVVDILQAHYGADRASLAVPGDLTDLENVPWGQKATFQTDGTKERTEIAGSERGKGMYEDGLKEEITYLREVVKGMGPPSSKRPSLLSRHSFAGFGKEKKIPDWRESERPLGPKRTKSIRESEGKEKKGSTERPERGKPESVLFASGPAKVNVPRSATAEQTTLVAVFPVPRALETEADPLIKRTGVVKLFGRTKPAVLTREYSYCPASQASEATASQASDDRVQTTPSTDSSEEALKPSAGFKTRPTRSRSTSNVNPPLSCPMRKEPSAHDHRRTVMQMQRGDVHLRHDPTVELYEEYEQTPQSPWSQSPAPSPAPKTHSEQNPFFTSHAVDEAAFARNPPLHNYGHAHSLAAIGVDRSKSVVHIPLLHAVPSQHEVSETLRFPVAIVSFLSSIVPYPANLRSSLTHLIPHLTTSFSLAQQYSRLEKQIATGIDMPRYGQLLGLGGTFSDVSSELELVAELSGHVSYSLTDGGSLSARTGLNSPDAGSGISKYSPSVSMIGTPGTDPNNSRYRAVSEPSATPGGFSKQGNDSADGYFTLQQGRGSNVSTAQGKARTPKTKQNSLFSMPASPGTVRGRSIREEGSATKDSTLVETPLTMQEARPTPGPLPSRPSPRNSSTTSLMAHLQRDFSRPFSDTIAQLMLNSVPLHLFLAKPQSGEVIWTNTKFDAYRRSQPQEPRVRDPWQNIHPNEVEHIAKEWAKALRTGSQFTGRVRVKRFNDETAYRWFIFRANPLLSATGELLYWIGSFLDIHEQHTAELQAAQEREIFATDAKYRALANSIPQVVFEAAENHGIISANEQWHLYTGQTIEEAMNFGFTKHVHRDDLERCGVLSSEHVEPLAQSIATDPILSPESHDTSSKSLDGCTIFSCGLTPALNALVQRGVVAAQKDENGRVFYSTEIRFRSRGGDYRWHLVRLVKVETSSFGNGEASWYGTCTDINDRKLLERELNIAMQKLNNEMESKTKFFSNMSHEIRTPLNGILGTIPFILDTQLDSDQRRMLDTIQNSSTNLRELVDNILDVSRVEAGKMNLVNSWFHVRTVVEDVIDTISSRAIDKGLEINYLMDVDVPPMVIGDRFRFRQVLINLMGNAVKFTTQGEIYTRCSIRHDPSASLRPTEALLSFDVVDTGRGFSVTDAERLMQRFTQIGGNGSQQNAGSGLGLFLSKQLVEMHGGRLTPSSKEGQGAKFSFHIKVDAPPPPRSEGPALTRRPSSEVFDPQISAPTTSSRGVPNLSRDSSDSKFSTAQDVSPAHRPPSLVGSYSSSDPSIRSMYHSERSSVSSTFPTPELHAVEPSLKLDASFSGTEEPLREDRLSSVTASIETKHPQSTPRLEKAIEKPDVHLACGLHPTMYSILILCSLDHAREAIKQHIEQVIPLEVPSTVKSVLDVEDWRDLVYAGDSPTPTHLVLNLPGTDDVLEVMHRILHVDTKLNPALVIISDLFQKRQIGSKIEELISAGINVYTVPKPVKPSSFSRIFDPENKRDLSKDRNQDMAREVNNNFKTMSKMVKEVIGNKGYRILLVEDDETNRMVMLKYLDKIKVSSETAGNGQECVEMVFSQEPGYYSLIICDIQMPMKNGYDTCREIRDWEQRNRFPQVPIMALSANAMTDQIDDAARAGFNDYVTKPIKHNELGKMMIALLDPNRPQILLRDRRLTTV